MNVCMCHYGDQRMDCHHGDLNKHSDEYVHVASEMERIAEGRYTSGIETMQPEMIYVSMI